MSESFPYSPPLGSCNRPSVGGQRVSSDMNPRTLTVIWLPVISVVPWVCCHRRCFLSRCWQMARWTHSGWLWRFPEWNQNTGPGPLLMECQMPAVWGAAREMKDSHLSRQMRKQICFRRLSELKTQLCTCTLLLVGIWDREKSCFHMTGVCVIVA